MTPRLTGPCELFVPQALVLAVVLAAGALAACGGEGSAGSAGPTAGVDSRRTPIPLDAGFAAGGLAVATSPLSPARPNIDVRALLPESDGGLWAVGVIGPVVTAGAIVKLTASGQPDPVCGAAGIKVLQDVAGREKPFLNSIVRAANGTIYVGGVAGFVPFAARLDPASCSLDPSFGSSGAVLMPDARAVGDTAAYAVVDRADRVLIVANRGGQALLARFDAAGRIDVAFGANGVASISVPGGFTASSAVFDRQGRLYLGGHVAATSALPEAAIVRLQPSGSIDVGFGAAGLARFAILSLGIARITSLIVLPDDTLVALGNTAIDAGLDSIVTHDSFALRLRTDGLLDPSFGAGGWVRWDWGYAQSNLLARAVVRSDGRIAACGHAFIDLLAGQRAALVQLLASGAMDAAAAGAGRALLDPWPNSDCFALAEDEQGRLLLGGTLSTTRAFIARTMR